MSIYEVLIFAAFVGVGFAYSLHRQDTRPKAPGEKPPGHPKGRPMFERVPPSNAPDTRSSALPEQAYHLP